MPTVQEEVNPTPAAAGAGNWEAPTHEATWAGQRRNRRQSNDDNWADLTAEEYWNLDAEDFHARFHGPIPSNGTGS